jgi:succinate dehydrogenase / fumarate reductase cytochrome b subunit
MKSTIAQKTLMALTGLFLCLFLTIHLLGNLQLFLPDEQARRQFNWYADLLSHSPVIEVAAIGTYLAILAHTLLALLVTIRNRRAAGTGYQATAPSKATSWYSRSMGILGSIILVFLIVHMADFWFPFKTGMDIGVDDAGRKDLYGLVALKFQQGWRIVLYEAGVLAVGFHLLHGFYSGLRSLGVHHPGYATALRWLGYAFTVVVTIGFGLMPIYMYISRS